MYLKLALRNAKRSVSDYILYIFTMITLTSVICISNCTANWGDMQAGFQTMALPMLIVLIMAVLVNYINMFIVKQRAKEFATYMLLGMEKSRLSLVFLCELFLIGLICFLFGAALGTGIFYAYYCALLRGAGGQSILKIITKSILQTFVYFCCVEILSVIFMKRKIYKLQIVQLIREKQRNQPLKSGKKSFWGWTLVISFFCYLLLLSGISFMPDQIMPFAISFVSLPMLLCVFAFYKWLYAYIAFLRLSRADALYQGTRLYRMAELTTGAKTGANLNTVFCICLIFSAGAFVFGSLLLHPDIHIFEQAEQQWMGFLQISICVIFMIIYFSIISLFQMIDLKRQARHIRLLFHLGKNQSELKILLCIQALVKLFLPTLMAFAAVLAAAPFVNYKLNLILPVSLANLTVRAVCGFAGCFFVLYLCYFCGIYWADMRYVQGNTKSVN